MSLPSDISRCAGTDAPTCQTCERLKQVGRDDPLQEARLGQDVAQDDRHAEAQGQAGEHLPEGDERVGHQRPIREGRGKAGGDSPGGGEDEGLVLAPADDEFPQAHREDQKNGNK